MADRSEVLRLLRSNYIPARVSKVEPEFIDLEEEMADTKDLEKLLLCAPSTLPNPHNSTLLYITGVSDEIDYTRGVDTLGGSMADVDSDFDTQSFHLLIEWLIAHYGREQVANILAAQKFKPRGIARKFYSVTAPEDDSDLAAHLQIQKEVLDCIPDALFGKEPTIQECIVGNEHKGFPAHPQLLQPKYAPFLNVATKLEGMVSTFGIHACGYAITDFPIAKVLPLWFRKTKDEYSNQEEGRWITQATMAELEEHGIIKFDFLRIENLAIIKECIRLIHERHGVMIDPYQILDEDEAAYKLICEGDVGGVFQLEASNTTREYAMRLAPKNLLDTAIIQALVRPGPLQAGLTEQFIKNKNSNQPPEDMPEMFVELLKDTYWVLAYQEQLIKIVNKIAGFSLAKSDAVRKAVGKKDLTKLAPYRDAFIKGCMANKISEEYATNFWDKVIVGMADYSFNLSHAVLYSYLTYICAWFKAHYPMEFFTALMGVRSQVLQPDKWADKAPAYIQEARKFNIKMHPPDINKSSGGFTISEDNSTIYFGLGSIRKVGAGASRGIVAARGNTPFKDIKDFFTRIDKSKINTGVFASLVGAGCFDSLGYARGDLLDTAELFYEWFKWQKECTERTIQNAMRETENIEISRLIEERDEIRKRTKKKGYEATAEELEFLENNKRLALKRPLAMPAEPPLPELTRHKRLSISIAELLTQGELIGCYIVHPVRMVYPHTKPISTLNDIGVYDIAGIVGDIKTYKNQRGNTTYISVSDGTGTLKVPIYSNNNISIPKKGQLIHVTFKGGRPLGSDDDDIRPVKVFRVLSLSTYEGDTQ